MRANRVALNEISFFGLWRCHLFCALQTARCLTFFPIAVNLTESTPHFTVNYSLLSDMIPVKGNSARQQHSHVI